ncbi:MAG: methyltransferase small [Caulobacteraceae bacterium]|nr:methyltransferase small [Caulobacteraceae bacterium]
MEITGNAAMGGKLHLLQPVRGYRAGLDAALLAAACQAKTGERVIEAGCGAGAALLAAARRLGGARFLGLERDPAMLDLAVRNIAGNGMGGRVDAMGGEVEAGFRALGLEPFDAALANPPYFDDPEAMRAPSPEKRGAWMADGGLGAWTTFLLKAVREGGSIVMIHRADRLADILALLSPKAGSFQIRPVAPHADAPAKRVVVRAIKTGKAPMVLLPPLVLHERGASDVWRPEAAALLHGETALEWAAN